MGSIVAGTQNAKLSLKNSPIPRTGWFPIITATRGGPATPYLGATRARVSHHYTPFHPHDQQVKSPPPSWGLQEKTNMELTIQDYRSSIQAPRHRQPSTSRPPNHGSRSERRLLSLLVRHQSLCLGRRPHHRKRPHSRPQLVPVDRGGHNQMTTDDRRQTRLSTCKFVVLGADPSDDTTVPRERNTDRRHM